MNIDWLSMQYTLIICIIGGIVQTITGFGFGIFVMSIFPLYLPLLESSALSGVVSLFLLTTLTWKYRKHIVTRHLLLPTGCYLLLSTVVIWYSPLLDLSWLIIFFAVVMIILSIYMLFFNQRVKVRATPVTAVICSSISGVVNGLFGIGGPPMSMYYLSVFGQDRLSYLGTSQCFFWITILVNNLTRLSNGILNKEVLLLVIPGVIGQSIGVVIGSIILKKLQVKYFHYIVYGFLALSGFITLITNL